MKKIVAIILSVLLVLTLFAGCKTESEKKDLVKVKVAHHMGYDGCGAVAVGVNMGYFEEEGLDVELVPFTAGPPEIASMVSGDIQFGYIGTGATNLAVKGEVEIMYFQNIGNGSAIVTNSDTGIKSVADLKGKTVATTLGTSQETLLNIALERAGVDVGDVEIINMDASGCVTAMLSGKVDAVSAATTALVTIMNTFGDKYVELSRMADFTDVYAPISSWLTTQKYIDENPEVVQSFANALAKCFDYWADHKEQVATWVAEIVEADEQTIKNQLNFLVFYNSRELKQKLDSGEIRKLYEVQQQGMLKDGKIDQTAPLDDYIKWEFMEKAIANTLK